MLLSWLWIGGRLGRGLGADQAGVRELQQGREMWGSSPGLDEGGVGALEGFCFPLLSDLP